MGCLVEVLLEAAHARPLRLSPGAGGGRCSRCAARRSLGSARGSARTACGSVRYRWASVGAFPSTSCAGERVIKRSVAMCFAPRRSLSWVCVPSACAEGWVEYACCCAAVAFYSATLGHRLAALGDGDQLDATCQAAAAFARPGLGCCGWRVPGRRPGLVPLRG